MQVSIAMLRLPAPIRAAHATAVHGFKAARACPGRRRSDAGPATRARSMPRARCITHALRSGGDQAESAVMW
jgi:hypothetical protein